MKKLIIINIACFFATAVLLSACKKNIGNLNSPVLESYDNPSKAQLNNLVSGTESGMRNNQAMYLDVVGMIGREMYRFSGAEPRYTSDLLGAEDAVLNNNTFYLNNPWGSRYRVIKNCNVLIKGATNSSALSAAEKKGYLGFAKTIKAHQLLTNLSMSYTNGIRLDVEDPDNIGPIVGYPESLTAIAGLLDEAKTDLTGADIVYSLSSGFDGFNTTAGLIKFNRALAARVAVYRQQWTEALTDLNESFFSLTEDFNDGVYNVFGNGLGDQLNLAFFPQNQNGEVRVAHPSYATDITPGDDRINKATLRTASASSADLSSNRDVWVYTSSLAPVPVIRNEELILIYAEAKIQSGGAGLADAVTALNKIRTEHNLLPYAGAVTQAALTDEMLRQRRFSLFFEGHRWVDMRRYNRLNQLPIDRVGDDVWEKFPLPLTEN
ncbi:MAG: RagB/SusD family nutrient uptake outer membrane protein [Chitinophagaceae bacterium]